MSEPSRLPFEFHPLPQPTRTLSSSGVEIATYDLGKLGGAGIADQSVLFAHATGFCAAVWAPVTDQLQDYHCASLDFRGHGLSSIPAAGMDWSGTAEDVLAVVDALGLNKPFGVGHSMGGASLLLAEQMRPGTFRGLWVYEPIVFPMQDSGLEPAGLKIQDISSSNPLVASALRRRDTFPSRSAAEQNFASKPPLSDLCPAALRAYVDHGFEQLLDGSITLRCRPEIEADTYKMGARHSAFAHLGEVACPVTVARGHTKFPGPADLAPIISQALPSSTLEEFPALGHFGPLQDPVIVAAAVRSALAAVSAGL